MEALKLDDASQEVARDVYTDEADPSITEAWQVTDLHLADAALARLGELERERAEDGELTKRAVERILLRQQLRNEKRERGIAFYRVRLEAYAATHRAELLTGKKKSRELPNGVISWRKVPEGLEVRDPVALLEWARNQPIESGVLRIKEEAALGEITKAFRATGEVPPGTEVKPESEKLSIEALGGYVHAK